MPARCDVMPCNAATPRNAMRCRRHAVRNPAIRCFRGAEQSQSKPMLIHCQATPSPRLARQIVAMQSLCFADLSAAKAFPSYALPPLCQAQPSYAHAEPWFAIGMLSTAHAVPRLSTPMPCFAVPPPRVSLLSGAGALPSPALPAPFIALPLHSRAGRGVALPSQGRAWHCFDGALPLKALPLQC